VARRVLMLSWEYPPVVTGGLGRHVCALAEALVAAGDAVAVVTRGRAGDPPAEIRAGVRVHRVAAPPMPHDLDAFLAWVDALNARMVATGTALAGRPDVVHGHDWLVAAAAAALVAVIPNGVTRRAPGPVPDLAAVRAGHAGPGEKLVVLSGRLVYEKGFQVALAALPAVVRRVGQMRFVIAGTGPHEAELRARARALGLDAHGAFLGWVGHDALDALYRVADVCVVPSLYEPFGLVALEAMAAGCPCVVADTGGLREIVPDDAGLRVRPGDPRALADAVTLVLSDPAVRARLATVARAHVRRFDWGDAARRTGAVYDALAAPRDRPRARRREAAARR
jgi:glycosyltransferase involved in cell wall biosynthesis